MQVIDGRKSLTGEVLLERGVDEHISDDACMTAVPALATLANEVVNLSNKLEEGGRDALFFGMQDTDPRLRVARLKTALMRRNRLEQGGFEPDPAYFAGASAPSRESFGNKKLHEDEWMEPPK